MYRFPVWRRALQKRVKLERFAFCELKRKMESSSVEKLEGGLCLLSNLSSCVVLGPVRNDPAAYLGVPLVVSTRAVSSLALPQGQGWDKDGASFSGFPCCLGSH